MVVLGNTLYCSDNLEVLREHIPAASVDLIYLDPPFKSNQDYNVLFREQDDSRSVAQIKAFRDTWQWDQTAAAAYREVVEGGSRVSPVMQAFRTFLGPSDMLAYLSMMAPRLLELHRVLKPTGSLYLHCDPTASHYLKLLLDAIFGPTSFRNEIIWSYRTGGVSRRYWPRKHDVLLFYVASGRYRHQPPKERIFTSVSFSPRRLTSKVGILPMCIFGTCGTTSSRSSTYPVNGSATPRRSRKPCWSASSRRAAGKATWCSTRSAAAVPRLRRRKRLGRRWIGIDTTHLAINLTRYRLRDAFGADSEDTFTIIGEPGDLAGAEALAQDARFRGCKS